MIATLKAIGNRIDLSGPGGGALNLNDATRRQLGDWRRRYRQAQGPMAPDLLRVLGREMYDWLNSGGWASHWLGTSDSPQCEIAADKTMTPDQRLLLSLPWEILANENGHLAEDPHCLFEVWRRIGPRQAPVAPVYKNLSLLFMAASPINAPPELDFELEEAAILKATERLNLGLTVEESGCPEWLAERLRGGESFDALHLSCHGDLLDEAHASQHKENGAKPGPNLLMETDEGLLRFVPPAKLGELWAGSPPRLVVLSACRTAEAPTDATEGTTEAFAAQLARGVPTVIGWDGSVHDPDATAFAETFCREIAGYKSITAAASIARRTLLSSQREAAGSNGGSGGTHWHLARLWLGPTGGGPLCRRDGQARDFARHAGFKTFLDAKKERVQVAGPLTFVGRRRLAQDAIRALRQDQTLGVLLLGIGNLGKSSLAARVANRLPHLQSVVLCNDYDAKAVLDAVSQAVSPEVRDSIVEQWRGAIDENPRALQMALESLLRGPLYNAPILLIIDDIEQILEDPAPGQSLTTVKRAYGWADSLVDILMAFEKARHDSRLMLTSRYDFAALDSKGRDLAKELCRIQLTPFSVREREKQWRAELLARLRSEEPSVRVAAARAIEHKDLHDLRSAAVSLADGNPGLQDILTGPLLSGEFDAVRRALDAMRRFFEDPSEIPDEANRAFEFFRRMTFDKYRAALTQTQKRYLAANTVFGDREWPKSIETIALAALQSYQAEPVPVPAEAMDSVGKAAGVNQPAAARQRLLGLGLVDVYISKTQDKFRPEFLVNRFARPIIDPLSDGDRAAYASAALPSLREVWAGGNDSWPSDTRSVEALRLALLAKADP